MEMIDGLTGGFSDVDTDVESVGGVLRLELAADLIDEIPEILTLIAGQIEIAGDVPAGDDQGMARSDGKDIEDGKGFAVLGPYRLRIDVAEYATHGYVLTHCE